MSKWIDTDTQPVPIVPSQPRRLTPDEAHLIERGLDTWHDATGTPRQQPIIPQPRPWPKATAPGTGRHASRRRTANPLAFGRALSEPSISERITLWCDRHSLLALVIVTALCVAAVLLWGGL